MTVSPDHAQVTITITDGFSVGWGVQDRGDSGAILFCTAASGIKVICNRPPLQPTADWLPMARKIANSLAAAADAEPVKGVALTPDGEPLLIDDMEWHFAEGFRPLYAAPVLHASVESLSLTRADVNLLIQLTMHNHPISGRPILTKPGPRVDQAERLSRLGLIALEQRSQGVQLHVTKLGTQLVLSETAEDAEKR
jgi:hypothetical protein